MPTNAQASAQPTVEHRFFVAIDGRQDVLGVIIPRGLAPEHQAVVDMAVMTLPNCRQSPLLAEVWGMESVHGRGDWITSLEVLQRAAKVPFPRTTVLSLTDPA